MRRGSIPNRVSIEQRPALVGQTVRIGDWELDTVHGKNNAAVMLTMVERAREINQGPGARQEKTGATDTQRADSR